MEELKLVGYFARNTEVPADWSISPATAHVKEICSAGGCVNLSPPGWLEHWLHNEWGFFNSPMDARLVVPEEAKEFALFAYRLLPVRFVQGRRQRLEIAELAVEALPPPFVPIGFDALNRVHSAYFECAPLSCNYLAAEVPVNEFCLMETLEQAVAAAEQFSRQEPEPGPYFVLEVLRECSAPLRVDGARGAGI